MSKNPKVIEGKISDLLILAEHKGGPSPWKTQDFADQVFMALAFACLPDRIVRLALPNGRTLSVRLETPSPVRVALEEEIARRAAK